MRRCFNLNKHYSFRHCCCHLFRVCCWPYFIPTAHELNSMLQISSLNSGQDTWGSHHAHTNAYLKANITSKVMKSCFQMFGWCQFLEFPEINNPHLLSATISQVHTGVKTHRAPNGLQILFSTFLTFLNDLTACMHEHILVSIATVLAATLMERHPPPKLSPLEWNTHEEMRQPVCYMQRQHFIFCSLFICHNKYLYFISNSPLHFDNKLLSLTSKGRHFLTSEQCVRPCSERASTLKE